ncbi:MAG TPA: TlpA disulfide reductase family protein [Solirubrobacteraceae bacterium]|nr:TlpA disulfide reductase family protein [Solirubrobacteraceae bacterium]
MTRIAPRRLLAALAAAALAAVLAVGVIELASSRSSPSTGGLPPLTLPQVEGRLAGSPPALAALHGQGSLVLTGGERALKARLASLRGYPLVIDKWASWCVPCQSERPIFQHASTNLGRRVAFLGIDSSDTSLADAQAFLRPFPVAYPSYYDPSGSLGLAVTDSSFTPVTVFYDRSGRQYIHQGPYPSLQKLERDVRRYALDG